jgi:anti-sigma factor ChrR (cupin superfamily)
MYQTKVRESQLPWADLGMPGVTMKVLHKDEATGAMAVLTRLEPGAVIPAHWHTQADETVYVLEGDFVEDGESYGPGELLPWQGRNDARPALDRRGLHGPDALQRRP